jgi:hypothetical protein
MLVFEGSLEAVKLYTDGPLIPATWVYDADAKGNTLYFTAESTSNSGGFFRLETETTATRLAKFNSPCLSLGFFADTILIGMRNPGNVLKSKNGGTVWDTCCPCPGASSVYRILRLSTNKLLAGTGDSYGDIFQAIFKCGISGGVMQGPTWAYDMSEHSGVLYSCTNHDSSELWKSTNQGLNWNPINMNFPGTQLYDCFWESETLFVGMNNSQGIMRSTNVGTTWDSVPKPGGVSDVYCFLKPQGRNFLIGTGNTYGDIFQALYPGIGGSILPGASWAYDAESWDNELWCGTGTDSGRVWRSTDDGLTWQKKTNTPGYNTFSLLPVDFSIYTATDSNGRVYVSYDKGDIWRATASPAGASKVYSMIWSICAQPARILAGTGDSYGDVFVSDIAISQIVGYVKYYSNLNPVESTNVVLTGAVVDTTLTNSTGLYFFYDLPPFQNYTVTPYKINSQKDSAVGSYDAAFILQNAVGMRILDSLQRIAADVSGNGQITSYDAALILRYVVCMLQHFPVGDWTFRPPSKSYTSLNSNQLSQNYRAILYGDVSGNWHPRHNLEPTAFDILSDNLIVYGGNLPENEDKITTNEHELTRSQGVENKIAMDKHGFSRITETTKNTEFSTFPIEVPNAKDVISADIILTYNPNEIEIEDVTLGTSTADYLIAWSNSKGIVRIAMAGTRPISGDVELVKVLYNSMNHENKIATPSVAYGTRFALRNDKKALIQISSMVLNEKPIITMTSSEGIAGNKTEAPTQFLLSSNQPNPFKFLTAIRYALPIAGKVSLQIYDVSGAAVKTLVNELKNPGYYSIQWNGTNNLNQKVASGVYFCELKTDKFTARKKMTILR